MHPGAVFAADGQGSEFLRARFATLADVRWQVFFFFPGLAFRVSVLDVAVRANGDDALLVEALAARAAARFPAWGEATCKA